MPASSAPAAPKVSEPSPVVPAPLALPTGSGCGPEIARTKAIVDSDVATGNLNKPVGDRFNADLSQAAAECAAGKSGEALTSWPPPRAATGIARASSRTVDAGFRKR